MPDASFYVLPSDSELERFKFACKLAEKVYRADNKIYILTDSESQSQKLDDLLWTFRAGSFVPHQIYSKSVAITEIGVLIGTSDAPENWQKTIINVSQHCPGKFEHTQRILEILDNDEAIKQAGRQRYREYQQADFSINTHKM